MRLLLLLFLGAPWWTSSSAQQPAQQPPLQALQWFQANPSDSDATRTCLGALQGDFSYAPNVSVLGSQKRSISKAACAACGSAGRCPDDTKTTGRAGEAVLYVDSMSTRWEKCSERGSTDSLHVYDGNGTLQTLSLQLCQTHPSPALVVVIVVPSLVLACALGGVVCCLVRRKRSLRTIVSLGPSRPTPLAGEFELKMYTLPEEAEGGGSTSSKGGGVLPV